MTRAPLPSVLGVLLSAGRRTPTDRVQLELFVDAPDSTRSGMLVVEVQGQALTIEGPRGERFVGTLAGLCDLLAYAEEYARADAWARDAARELEAAREIRAEAAQTKANLARWIAHGSCPTCDARAEGANVLELHPRAHRRTRLRDPSG